MSAGFRGILELSGVFLASPSAVFSSQRIRATILSASRGVTLHSEERAAQLLSPSRSAALKVQGDVINV